MIEVKGITKAFEKKAAPVIKDISLKVEEGEILCLLGPSGAGKTTLIRLITGALRADDGVIMIGDIEVPSRKLYKEMGYMPQEDALYNDLTGLENLMFFAGLYGIKGKDSAFEVLKLMNLFEDKDKLVSNYSGGMKKRLSLAVALLHKPKLLLLDEPTVGIDPVLRQTIWEQLYKLRDAGTCIVVSTHVMDEAAKCNRAALIYEGAIIYDDTVDNLLSKTDNGQIEELFFMAKEGQK